MKKYYKPVLELLSYFLLRGIEVMEKSLMTLVFFKIYHVYNTYLMNSDNTEEIILTLFKKSYILCGKEVLTEEWVTCWLLFLFPFVYFCLNIKFKYQQISIFMWELNPENQLLNMYHHTIVPANSDWHTLRMWKFLSLICVGQSSVFHSNHKSYPIHGLCHSLNRGFFPAELAKPRWMGFYQ